MSIYTDRHKNLKAYRIGRGTITRRERDHKGVEFTKRYVAGETIMLTSEGAKQLHGNHLQETSRETVQEIATSEPKRIEVPDDWQEMRRADMLALAAAIAGKPVRKTEAAAAIIQEYLDGTGDSDSE